MGEERWVGESDDDFPWWGDFNRRRWSRDGLWDISWFFSSLFFFCNQIVIMFKGTKDSCSASYEDNKPISKGLPARFTSS